MRDNYLEMNERKLVKNVVENFDHTHLRAINHFSNVNSNQRVQCLANWKIFVT